MARTRMVAGLLVAAALLSGCAAADPVPDAASVRDAEVVEGSVVLDGRVLASPEAIPGAAVHASLRPGGHEADTVVILSRVDDELGERFELQYLVADGDAISEVYGFPWRLQVAEELSSVLDVAPVPVWAPDGEALAWIEWVPDGTRLRTVGWIDDGTVRNPSDDADAYALREIPAGVQLEGWQRDPDGTQVLLGRQDGQPYRIRLGETQPRSVTTVRIG